MKQVIKADSRGFFDYDWLKTYHSFSFSSYYDPARTRFGVLRVLNDDYIAGGQGFGLHPHNDMEIVSIILEGKLTHSDSKKNEHTSSRNGIQVMSAGSGIYHSEYNGSDADVCNLLQIWVFPDEKGREPRYGESQIDEEKIKDNPYLFVGPESSGANLWINQNAYFSMVETDTKEIDYKLYDSENGVYIFLIEGKVEVNETEIHRRDAVALTNEVDIKIKPMEKSKVLIIEVPLINGE